MAVLTGGGQAYSDEKAAQATQFVAGLADKAVSALTVPDITREERESRFRQLLSDYFAVTTIGQWVLGRYWRQATVEERREYLALFEDLIVVTYLNRFQRYSGEKLNITKSLVEDKSGDAVVFTEIERPAGGKPVSVAWRLRAKGTSFKVVDLVVEGVSMGQTQRREFASVIGRNGGKIEGLLAEMRQKVKS